VSRPRIALVHATPAAVEPIDAALARDWPDAQRTHLLDDSLSADLASAGGLTPALTERFVALARYVRGCGADAVLFTCSAFGAAIEAAADAVDVPVHKPNEALFLDALALGGEVLLLTTFAPAQASMQREFAALHGQHPPPRPTRLRCVQVEGAMAALLAGDAATHDRLIAEAAAEAQASGAVDVVLLGQFSMARAQPVVAERLAAPVAVPVFSSPASAVRRLRASI
jgi:hypothetical protein